MNLDKIVIFDWGGVIESHSKDDNNNLFDRVIKMMRYFDTSLSDIEIIQTYRECSVINNSSIFSLNKKDDIKDWFKNVKEKLKIKCNFDEFTKAYKEYLSDVYYYKEVVDFAHSLKDKCKIGIFSNLMFLDKERLDFQVNLSKFDYVFLSFEKNCRKPEEKACELVENETNIKCDNILFIDDLEENVNAAKSRGWNTCKAYGYELDLIKQSVDEFLKLK